MKYVKEICVNRFSQSDRLSLISIDDIDKFITLYEVGDLETVTDDLHYEMCKAVAKEIIKWVNLKKLTKWKNLTSPRRRLIIHYVLRLVENKTSDQFCRIALYLGLTCHECPLIVYGIIKPQPRLLKSAAPLLEVCWGEKRQFLLTHLLSARDQGDCSWLSMEYFREFVKREQPARIRALKTLWLRYKANPALWEDRVREKMNRS